MSGAPEGSLRSICPSPSGSDCRDGAASQGSGIHLEARRSLQSLRSDSASLQDRECPHTKTMDEEDQDNTDFSDPTLFLNNNVSETLSKRPLNANSIISSGVYTQEDRQKCLKLLGLYDLDPQEEMPCSEAMGMTLSSAVSYSSQDDSSQLSPRWHAEHAKQGLYRVGVTSDIVQRQHMELVRIIDQIFARPKQPLHRGPSQRSTISGDTISSFTHSMHFLRLGASRWRAKRFLDNSLVSTFFLCVTIYALLGPDVVAYIGLRSLSQPFAIINSVVFLIFAVELTVLLLGNVRYYFTAAFVFDIICLFSMLQDTWLLQKILLAFDVHNTILTDQGTRVSRLARSSRAVRLLRIAKLARVARLIPHLMALFRRQNMKLGRMVLMRRLWRIFTLLDTDDDNMVSSFDLKATYMIILLQCPDMIKGRPIELLKADKPKIISSLSRTASEEESSVDWNLFCKIMMSTRMGKQLLAQHVEEIEKDEGVWSLTQKLSDSTAMKVCAGIIVLIGAVTLLEVEIIDLTIETGLGQMAAMMTSSVRRYACETIGLFLANNQADPYNRIVMYLNLNGSTFIDNSGGCMDPPLEVGVAEAHQRVQGLIEASPVAYDDLVEACWPDPGEGRSCDAPSVSSLVLVNIRSEERTEALLNLGTTMAIMFLLLLFVAVVNRKITTFTRTLLQPLRWLVDDMVAIASLELLQICKDLPDQSRFGPRDQEVVEELVQLEDAFRSMQSAIRSWSLYVPPCVVQRLFAAGIEASIGMARVHVTILFCDIAGFEDTRKGLDPKEVISLLERVLNDVAEVIQMHNGTLLEFIGDEVLAVFNTPTPLKHHSLAGAMAARDIHRVLDANNVRDQVVSSAGQDITIRCRCGVHTAYILAGNIGSQKRIKYGLLGDGINLAARLKGLNSRYHTRTLATDVLVGSGSVLKRFEFAFRPVDKVAVKGKKDPTTVYELMTTPAAETAESRAMFEACRKHKDAFLHYQNRHFSQAKEKFEEVGDMMARAGMPRDVASQLLMKRCEKFIDEPPPPEWDGVDRLAKKSFEEEMSLWEAEQKGSGEKHQACGCLVTGGAPASRSNSEVACLEPAKGLKAVGSVEVATPASLDLDDGHVGELCSGDWLGGFGFRRMLCAWPCIPERP